MIISASRRTDIPAYYSDWFIKRLQEGFALARNPMNPKQVSRISLGVQEVDGVVFWSKNPQPMLNKLDALKNYAYYFQFTLNAYGQDIEPGLPGRFQRIETFQPLSDKLSPEKVIWRYDPIALSDRYSLNWHIQSFGEMAANLKGYTKKVIISFLDLYPKIEGNIKPFKMRPPSEGEKHALAQALAGIAKENGLLIETCAEEIDLSAYGIGHGCCIDGNLMARISGRTLNVKKDRNQRQACGCAASVDIGAYHCCPNGCVYCYANYTLKSAKENYLRHQPLSPLLLGEIQPQDVIKQRV